MDFNFLVNIRGRWWIASRIHREEGWASVSDRLAFAHACRSDMPITQPNATAGDVPTLPRVPTTHPLDAACFLPVADKPSGLCTKPACFKIPVPIFKTVSRKVTSVIP